MGLFSFSFQVAAVSVVVAIILDLRHQYTPKLGVAMDGYVAPGWEKVAEAFRQNLQDGVERGGAFSVYYQGALVIDVYGGYADLSTEQPWERDTIGCFTSATTGVGAVLLAMLVDRGLMQYKKPVMDYWPEFGVHGKEKISVKLLLSNQGGVVSTNSTFSGQQLLTDPQAVSSTLANAKPWWDPGTKHGFHPLTLGFYMDQLVRRVDPQHRDIGQFFEEELSDRFGLDFFIGLPKEENYRVARTYPPPYYGVLEILVQPRLWKVYIKYLTDSHFGHILEDVEELQQGFSSLNNPYTRELPMASVNGYGTAHSLAKLYGILANGGSHEDKKLLPKKLIDSLYRPVVSGADEVLDGWQTSYTMGFWNIKNPNGSYTFGHPGFGGNMAFADPSHKLGWAYVTNFPSMNLIEDLRYKALEAAMYDIVLGFGGKGGKS